MRIQEELSLFVKTISLLLAQKSVGLEDIFITNLLTLKLLKLTFGTNYKFKLNYGAFKNPSFKPIKTREGIYNPFHIWITVQDDEDDEKIIAIDTVMNQIYNLLKINPEENEYYFDEEGIYFLNFNEEKYCINTGEYFNPEDYIIMTKEIFNKMIVFYNKKLKFCKLNIEVIPNIILRIF